MIAKGNWQGYYQFDNKRHESMRGHKHTYFGIAIVNIADNRFSGTVQDDLASGGTEGIGEITGTVDGDEVEFIKQMPVMTVLRADGTRQTFNKKHRKIYYAGKLSADGMSISGQWRFKFGFLWIGIIPIPMPPTSGTWTMTFKRISIFAHRKPINPTRHAYRHQPETTYAQ
ncbi:hypothetical protein [Mucilaginibacter psychrotolerans]|uniref:Uncharacterized protein n=1 Tax=Mucilaginibacter psychrotolerans TaxID=1524096 RepID=A0A4Y8SD90_9SPHI|nr:hypothetical protein [Mucilaginibacter psychrotolerans]TFF36326.1 hypothetical protein E2R66_15940 [Mucilaginibacter psychrotolerans]